MNSNRLKIILPLIFLLGVFITNSYAHPVIALCAKAKEESKRDQSFVVVMSYNEKTLPKDELEEIIKEWKKNLFLRFGVEPKIHAISGDYSIMFFYFGRGESWGHSKDAKSIILATQVAAVEGVGGDIQNKWDGWPKHSFHRFGKTSANEKAPNTAADRPELLAKYLVAMSRISSVCLVLVPDNSESNYGTTDPEKNAEYRKKDDEAVERYIARLKKFSANSVTEHKRDSSMIVLEERYFPETYDAFREVQKYEMKKVRSFYVENTTFATYVDGRFVFLSDLMTVSPEESWSTFEKLFPKLGRPLDLDQRGDTVEEKRAWRKKNEAARKAVVEGIKKLKADNLAQLRAHKPGSPERAAVIKNNPYPRLFELEIAKEE